MTITAIRGKQVLDGSIQRADLDTTTVGQALVTKVVQGVGVSLSSTGADSGTGDVTISAGSVVSADAGNQSKLGSDSLIYTPGGINGFVSKTAAYTLTQADRNKYVICSGGSWTLTLPTAAAGLSYNVRNDMGITGTIGTITISPPSGTIDGSASIALLPQQECVIICDGTNWRTFGKQRVVILGTQDITTSTASASVLLPVGYRVFELLFTAIQPATNRDSLVFQLSSNGGTTWITTGYNGSTIFNNAATTVTASSDVNLTFGRISAALNTGSALGTGLLTLWPGTASIAPNYLANGQGNDSTFGDSTYRTGGRSTTVGIANALKYFCNSGNMVNVFLTVKGFV